MVIQENPRRKRKVLILVLKEQGWSKYKVNCSASASQNLLPAPRKLINYYEKLFYVPNYVFIGKSNFL